MVNRRSPSFFKILLDASAPHLPLPPDFVSWHLKNKIPKNPTIQTETGGHSWKLKIKKIGECFCFTDGWDNVVEDIKLDFGDFLVFRLVSKSVFDMVVFGKNGCEKDIPEKIEDEDDEDDDDDEEEEEDDDDEDVKVKVKVKHEVDDDEEEDEIDYDGEDDDDDDGVEEYEEKEDGDDDDEEEEDAEGGIDGNDGDPFFMVDINKSHKSMMRLPMEFSDLAGLDDERKLILKNLDDKEWETRLRFDKSNHRYYISAGWPSFRNANLCDGDKCVFKFIKSEDKLLLAKVNKKKRLATEAHSPVETRSTKIGKRRKAGKRRRRR